MADSLDAFAEQRARSGPGNGSKAVSISASARLHMGFFDLNGELGRRYGSIGVCLDRPATLLQAWHAPEGFTADGPGAERAVAVANTLARALGLGQGMHMHLLQAIPEHAGLGAGTQISLAVGLALSELYGLDLTAREIAVHTERGARSGIGLGTFAAGGVVVDGGRGGQTDVPPIIARTDFPKAWRILLILDKSSAGVHGKAELEAFRTLPAFPAGTAAMLCRRVLMQALPALAEQDLPAFGAAIRELQVHTGDYFAPVQGGRYASTKVAAVLDWLEAQHMSCYGQSSWGPTGFAILEDEQRAAHFLRLLQERFTELEFMMCKGRNEGAILCDIDNTQAGHA